MSEEAAAAIDADAARDVPSQSKAHKPFSDSAHGFHDADEVADGCTKQQKTVDASQLAEKVGVAALGPVCGSVGLFTKTLIFHLPSLACSYKQHLQFVCSVVQCGVCRGLEGVRAMVQ